MNANYRDRHPHRPAFLGISFACVLAGSVLFGTACGGGADKAAAVVIDPGDGGNYRPTIDPANFVARIDNPYCRSGLARAECTNRPMVQNASRWWCSARRAP